MFWVLFRNILEKSDNISQDIKMRMEGIIFYFWESYNRPVNNLHGENKDQFTAYSQKHIFQSIF